MYDCLLSSPISLSLSKTFSLPIPSNPTQNGTSFLFLRGRAEPTTYKKKKNPSVLGSRSEEYGFRAELGFKEKAGDPFDDYETNRGGKEAKRKKSPTTTTKKRNGRGRREGGEANSSSSEFLELKEEKESGGERRGGFGDENLVRLEDNDEEERLGGDDEGRMVVRKGRQVMRRSSLLAKQVISVRSALSLGFVSQLWVDTTSWVVLFLEVRPNLLSGECERFLLEDVSQVGDVVLVEDETVIENDFKMIGLETLVGYKVVTPGRRNIGKVRGYTFNINSGAMESLELDSFGISIIPSSLVSTYALLVEDVLEVLSDAVVIHEAAASRIQRLTKGFLDSQNVGTNIDDLEEYGDFERPLRSDQSTKGSGTRKFRHMNREFEDDWELPMDYL
ncbi:hypothetical protein TIFTF001_009850 [Ficus carica]|uniref:PRC-barrel-like protein n=1 Tax=Ficus carica TaxID=3494 RepID=A0AA87ZVE8_FICCA|nr:hypothetical protein TIFTF001_009850 [Ficus carica]